MPSSRIHRIEAADMSEKTYIVFEELVAAGFSREEALAVLVAILSKS